ncbi:CLUMA_CG020546, isoform A [Clunio marinus]|uniref:CLUMA_CG020546, isoform A n=1 Tax=Clunio marinus TaxID=568069 RepID=A0A1J1J595_9DIPT|nr:CLUMA_CG020546, isoform A [Clunio marinus]
MDERKNLSSENNGLNAHLKQKPSVTIIHEETKFIGEYSSTRREIKKRKNLTKLTLCELATLSLNKAKA